MNKKQVCPLCQLSNQCGVNEPAGCWCMQQNVPADLIALLPESAINIQCICSSCIASFNHNAKQFKQGLLNKT